MRKQTVCAGHLRLIRSSMQALVVNNGLHYCSDLAIPVPNADEALIRPLLAGICATDLELIKGYAAYTGIIGHEFVGTVVAVANDRDQHWLNQRVVGSINIGCRSCQICQHIGEAHCPDRKVLGIRGHAGVFADYFTLPIGNLYRVPDTISDEIAVFTEPLAAAIRVLEQLRSLNCHRVAVLGPGRLGILIAKVLSLADYEVVLVGRSERSLDLPGRWQLDTALIGSLAECAFDMVVEVTGQPEGFRHALRILKPRGVLLLKSTYAEPEPLDLSKIVVGELNILGSRCGPFDEALALLQQQTVPVATLIDGCYPLVDGLRACQHASQPGVRKILLKP